MTEQLALDLRPRCGHVDAEEGFVCEKPRAHYGVHYGRRGEAFVHWTADAVIPTWRRGSK